MITMSTDEQLTFKMLYFLKFDSLSKLVVSLILALLSIYSFSLAQMPPIETPVFGRNIAGMSITDRPRDDENLYEWCSDWLNRSMEVNKREYTSVKAFCERILMSDNDADRFQAQQYLGALYREMKKLDTVIVNIVMRLSAYNDTKQAFLMDPNYKIPIYLGMCYWTLHEGFKKYCVDPESNKYVRTYRHIFAHVCQASWLNVKDALECFDDVCRDIKLFKNLPYPPEFLFGLEDKQRELADDMANYGG